MLMIALNINDITQLERYNVTIFRVKCRLNDYLQHHLKQCFANKSLVDDTKKVCRDTSLSMVETRVVVSFLWRGNRVYSLPEFSFTFRYFMAFRRRRGGKLQRESRSKSGMPRNAGHTRKGRGWMETRRVAKIAAPFAPFLTLHSFDSRRNDTII